MIFFYPSGGGGGWCGGRLIWYSVSGEGHNLCNSLAVGGR